MKKPAILLITCDELRRDTLSCYGNRAIETKHIDSLMTEGTAFDSCYTVSPWCLPARCAILTGQYPSRSGAYSNFRPTPLRADMDNLFTLLKGGGYHTSLFGKCHFAPVPYGETRADVTLPYQEFRDYYVSLGIDHLALQDDKNVSIWFSDDYSQELDKAGYLKTYRDVNWDKSRRALYPCPAPDEWHPDAWVGRKTVEYIQEREEDQPEFMWVSFSGPHYPFDTPASYYDRVNADLLPPMPRKEGELDDPGRIHHGSFHGGGNIDGARQAPDHACKNYSEEHWRKLRVSYNANMVLIDDMVGEILTAARARYGEDLLVIFTADHGEMMGAHGLWGKHNCGYEQVWNIPMLVRFPGQREAARTDVIVNLNDILPTCLDAAGLDLVESDGAPLRQRMKDGGLPYAFAEGEGFVAVTDRKRKYIHIEKPGEHFRELIDREADPEEFENRIDDPVYQEDLSRLRERLVDHFINICLP